MYKRLGLSLPMLMLFVMSLSITTVGQVIYKDVNTTLAPTQFAVIDIDNDGDNEIQILNDISKINLFTPTIVPGTANVQLLTHFFATSTVDQLGVGEVIGDVNNSLFRNGVANGCIGSCLSQNPLVWPSSVSDVYIAFRYTDVGTGFQHYGWMWIDIGFSGTTILEFTIRGIAYEATPSTDIVTGLIPVSSITVQGQGGVTTVMNPGSIQMEASVLPVAATNSSLSWTVDNTSIATVDASGVLTALNDGTVRVFATAQDGSGVSGFTDIVVDSTLSIDDSIQNDLKVTVYPNPFDNDVNINVNTISDSKETEILLVDLTGKVLYRESQKLILGENSIMLGNLNLSGGFYNLIIKTNNKTLVKKVVKL